MLAAQRVLFTLTAAFWLVTGGAALGGWVTFGMERGADVLGLLLIANGLALLGFGWLTVRGRNWVDFLGMAFVASNAVTSLLDEVGVYDIAAFLVNLVLLGLLIVNHRRATA